MQPDYKENLKSEILELLRKLREKLRDAEGDERVTLESQDAHCKQLYFDAQASDNEGDFVRRLEILRDALKRPDR
jgi:hypothetical protein